METYDLVDTPMVEKSKLDEDPQGKDVDPIRYCGMIGTLKYITSSRQHLVFVVCMCARYQAKPTKKHLHAVKRIFQYLRGTINMGLWYSNDSCIVLTAFTDVDHADCQDTRRSTFGSMQYWVTDYNTLNPYSAVTQDFVMSDSEDSTVTYTDVSSPFKDLSDIGSPGVIVHGYNGPTMMLEEPYDYVEAALQAPPSPDYLPGLEKPEQAPHPPDFVPELVYPEFMPPDDDVLPAEEQPLPTTVSPIADSPGYIIKFDPEEDPEEDDKDLEADPTDYSTNKDEDEEEEDESSEDDADDEDEDEDEDEEEEHLAPANFVLPPACRTTTRMSIRDQTPIPFPSAAEVDRFLAISTPQSSPLTSYSSPLPHIPSLPLLVSSPLPISSPLLPASPTHPLSYRAAMIRLRADSPSTSHPLPLLLPIVRESSYAPTARPTGGFKVDYGFVGTLDAEIRRDPYREIGYGITDIWEDPDEIAEEIPATNVAELGHRMTNFVMTVRQDTDEIYGRLDDAQDDRSLMSGQLNLLRRDRRAHARTTRLIEGEAMASREALVQSMDDNNTTRSETQMAALQSQQTPARDPTHPDAWGRSMDASDTARSEVRALRTTVLAQQTKITALQAANRAPQAQLMETLRLMSTLQTQVKALQGHQGPVSGPTQPEIPEEAGSSS
ncbi:hypothetical protein Tco_1145534 [Tanacetum coccineum]